MRWLTNSAKNATATIKIVRSMTKTALKTPVPHSAIAHQINGVLNTVTAQEILFTIAIPVLLYFLVQKIRNANQKAKGEDEDARDWDAPWLTLDWAALYGLFRIAHQDNWRQTPFWQHRVIQEHWNQPHRPWLRRLLAMGIMPLYMQDGGIDLHHVNFTRFGWKKEFPYFALPRYQQAKQRAYIEFVVPYRSIDARMEEFIQRLIDNRVEDALFSHDNFAVLLRYSPPTRGGRLFYSGKTPPLPEDWPFTIGAQSRIKWLLPFLPDKVLKKGMPNEILEGNKDIGPSLALYVKGPNAAKVTLLERTKSVLIRVEAQHYGICELGTYLYSVAREVGLTVQWPEEDCQRAAEEELARCALPIGGPEKHEDAPVWKFW